MLRMKAAGIDAFGGGVQLLELAAPAPPAPDEVVISVRAAGIGNWDEIVRVAGWDVGRRPPLALGVEAAGSLGINDHLEPGAAQVGSFVFVTGISRLRNGITSAEPGSVPGVHTFL